MKNILLPTLLLLSFMSYSQPQIRWNASFDLASANMGNNRPRIVVDRSGDPMVVWGNSGNVMFTKRDGGTFTSVAQLNPAGMSVEEADWMGPDIAAHGDTVYVVFKEAPASSTSSHIWCLTSFDGGLSFSAPVQVDNIADSVSRFPVVTTDDLGNPVIGFMKFNSSFGDARWVVTYSTDFGNSYSKDVKASGWSGPSSEVCDCCPGAIASSGSKVAMLYRDNDNDIRDNWVGISNNKGVSFSFGKNIDQQNWMLSFCPSSGPDGFIMGDTLYATFMNGAGGMNKVYFNKTSLSSMTSNAGMPITGSVTGLKQQNFSRIDRSGQAMAMVWTQNVNSKWQLPVLYTHDLSQGFPADYDTIASANVKNTDLALSGDSIYVVWQDVLTSTVKYRSGGYSPFAGIADKAFDDRFQIFPNPTANSWTISSERESIPWKIEVTNTNGQVVYSNTVVPVNGSLQHRIDLTSLGSGIYLLHMTSEGRQYQTKLLKQ